MKSIWPSKQVLASLTAVGWYLIAPPVMNEALDFAAPRSEWVTQHVFDSGRECDAMMTKWHERAERIWKGDKNDKATVLDLYILQNCTCIASDDPRLLEKRPPPTPAPK